jgi:hypothetical protein
MTITKNISTNAANKLAFISNFVIPSVRIATKYKTITTISIDAFASEEVTLLIFYIIY